MSESTAIPLAQRTINQHAAILAARGWDAFAPGPFLVYVVTEEFQANSDSLITDSGAQGFSAPIIDVSDQDACSHVWPIALFDIWPPAHLLQLLIASDSPLTPRGAWDFVEAFKRQHQL